MPSRGLSERFFELGGEGGVGAALASMENADDRSDGIGASTRGESAGKGARCAVRR